MLWPQCLYSGESLPTVPSQCVPCTQPRPLLEVRAFSDMRVAALPVLIASTVSCATPVRSIHVQAPHPEPAPTSPTPSEEQEVPDDEFQVRLTPEEMAAASGEAVWHSRSVAGCPICNLQSGATRKFYLLETTDGLGSRILNVIVSLIYAAKNDLRFAGVVPPVGIAETSHSVNISAGMQAFFGFADVSEFYVQSLPSESQRFPNLNVLSEQLARGAIVDGASVYVDLGKMSDYDFGVVPATVMQALRSKGTPLMQMPLTHFASRKVVNVAVHVRRGDVHAWDYFRGTADSYYFWVMDRVREKAPDADFHVFSEDHTPNADGEQVDMFDEYRKWGAYVHVNTEAREALAHMAKADVLITAKSSFSYVAAFISPNCVLQQPWKKRLPGWMQLPSDHTRWSSKDIENTVHGIHTCMNIVGAR